ncbi:hypothetical protein CSA17_02550 [bacterium DOLJORAL78_65_58]|nr:MAG: hypothetical protein CSB20_02425 [bacterium DOLZORAL124_64_63]PIE76381.1 MAG: hypothetical protein CSA17_02550 [bacterium DOLJORAL78_65_58]
MSRLIKLILVSALLVLATAQAQAQAQAQTQNIRPYTFGYLLFPDSDHDAYRLAWLRVGARMHPGVDLPGSLLVRTEFDISKSSFAGALKYGYAQWTNTYEGTGDVSLIAGKFLSPVSYVWPGPQQTRVIRMTAAQRVMPLYGTGVQVFYHGPLDARLAHVNAEATDETVFSGWANYKGLQLFFVQDLAKGAAFTGAYRWWLNGTVGVTHDDDADVDEFWLEHYLEYRGARLSTVLEMTDYEDEEVSVTLDVPYARFSSLRIGYATQDELVHGGVTFSY